MSTTTSGEEAEAPAKELTISDAPVKAFSRIRHVKKRLWLAAIAVTGKIRAAEKLSGISHMNHYQWLKKDSAYKAAFDEAMDRATDLAIDECFRRGVEGIEKPLSYQGKLTGHTIREYSDNLLMFFIKGRRPEFRDSFPLSQYNTGPIQFNVAIEGQGGGVAIGGKTPEGSFAVDRRARELAEGKDPPAPDGE